MSHNDQWMPWYLGDYFRDTRGLTTLQHGAYLLLIADYWCRGPLQNDPASLASKAGVKLAEWNRKIGPVLIPYFSIGADGLLHQKRLDTEIEKRNRISAGRREAVSKRKDRKATIVSDLKPAEATIVSPKTYNCYTNEGTTTSTEERKIPISDEIGRSDDIRAVLWQEGVERYRRLTGRPDARCRSRIGQLLKATKDDAARVMAVLRNCPQTDDPDAWISAAVKSQHRNGFLALIEAEGMPSVNGTPERSVPTDPVNTFISRWEGKHGQ